MATKKQKIARRRNFYKMLLTGFPNMYSSIIQSNALTEYELSQLERMFEIRDDLLANWESGNIEKRLNDNKRIPNTSN